MLIIALGFGFSLLIMAYVIGPISGCHINPAVTLGMLLARKVDLTHAVYSWIGQVVGAVGGAAIIYGIASGRDGFQRGQFAANLWSGQVLRARFGDRGRGAAHRAARDGRAVHHHQEVRPGDGRAGRRHHVDADPPDLDPGRQHVGQPGAQPRHRVVRRLEHRGAAAAVGLHPVPADRCRGRRRSSG